MAKLNLSQLMVAAEAASFFNSAKWNSEGSMSLKDLWETTHPGLHAKEAKVITRAFPNGDEALKLSITCDNGNSVELPLSRYSSLLDGDTVDVDSITATYLTKEGSNPIMRYDGKKA